MFGERTIMKTIHDTIHSVCLPCGNKYKTKDKAVFGMWTGICCICGEETGVAAAGHDFGIYEKPTNLQVSHNKITHPIDEPCGECKTEFKKIINDFSASESRADNDFDKGVSHDGIKVFKKYLLKMIL